MIAKNKAKSILKRDRQSGYNRSLRHRTLTRSLTSSLITVFIFSLALAGCDWEPSHDNPLDPENANFEPSGNLEITVLRASNNLPLENSEVRIDSLGIFQFTNQQGLARFNLISIGHHQVTAEKISPDEGSYSRDTLSVNILQDRTATDTFRLDSLPPPPNDLFIQVTTLNRRSPIPNATVQVRQYARLTQADEEGWAEFINLPVGEMWVTAFANSGAELVYAPDSIFVQTRSNAPTYEAIPLDALPYFIDVSVTSTTIQMNLAEKEKKIRLKAEVDDPDGKTDLDSVRWEFLELSGKLTYNQDSDSTFWEATIPSSQFPDGAIGIALDHPFQFEAFDDAGNSKATEYTLDNLINDTPNLAGIQGVPDPLIEWNFNWRIIFADITQFRYLFRIYSREPGQNQALLDTFLVSNGDNTETHQFGRVFEPGEYDCYVWVLDNFGNSSRSQRIIWRAPASFDQTKLEPEPFKKSQQDPQRGKLGSKK